MGESVQDKNKQERQERDVVGKCPRWGIGSTGTPRGWTGQPPGPGCLFWTRARPIPALQVTGNTFLVPQVIVKVRVDYIPLLCYSTAILRASRAQLLAGTIVTSGHDVTRCHTINKEVDDDDDDKTTRDGATRSDGNGLWRWCLHLPAKGCVFVRSIWSKLTSVFLLRPDNDGDNHNDHGHDATTTTTTAMNSSLSTTITSCLSSPHVQDMDIARPSWIHDADVFSFLVRLSLVSTSHFSFPLLSSRLLVSSPVPHPLILLPSAPLVPLLIHSSHSLSAPLIPVCSSCLVPLPASSSHSLFLVSCYLVSSPSRPLVPSLRLVSLVLSCPVPSRRSLG